MCGSATCALSRAATASLLVCAVAVVLAGCDTRVPTSPTPPVPPTTPINPTQPQPPVDPQPPPPTLTYTNFLAFGDSLTEGVITPAPAMTLIKLDSPLAYPAILQGLLAQRYTAQNFTVVNYGKGGEEAADGVSRFVTALGQTTPQVAMILEGFNDMSALGSKGIPQAITALESMIKQARARNVVVMLATLPPERTDGFRALPASLTDEFNRQVGLTAANDGATLVDLSHELSLASVGADGVHLTEAGYQEMANVYFRHIEAAYEQPSQTSAAKAKVKAHVGTR